MKQAKLIERGKLQEIADKVAETIFYHYTEGNNKEKLKDALIEFANIIAIPIKQVESEDEAKLWHIVLDRLCMSFKGREEFIKQLKTDGFSITHKKHI